MKIEKITTYKMTFENDLWVILTIMTDEGIAGWGEVTGSPDDLGVANLISKFEKHLVGKDPTNINQCMRALKMWSYPTTRNMKIYSTAISGIDQCLWDIKAKKLNLPLYQLYGSDKTDSIKLYANLNKAIRKQRSPQKLADNAKKALNAGFSLLKATPFDEVSPEIFDTNIKLGMDRLEALLDVTSIDNVAIDCHQRFRTSDLEKMLVLLKKQGTPYWLEDPIAENFTKNFKNIKNRHPEIRWATGEELYDMSSFFKVANTELYEVLMPDMKYVGGPSVVRNLIPAIEGLGLFATLHNPNGLIATAHSAHLSTIGERTLPLEFPFMALENRDILSTPKEIVKNGRYYFNDKPGIGIEITKEALKEFSTVLI